MQVPSTWPRAVANLWVMVLSRVRARSRTAPDDSLADVVCFVSDVSDTDVLPAQEMRVWCGVPSAVMEEDQALIFLTAEPSEVGAALGDSVAAGAAVASGVVTLRLDPAEFERGISTGTDMTSTPVGRVQLWVVEPGSSFARVRFEDQFTSAGPLKTADPWR